MSWLLHNPVADIPGPPFLVFFWVASAAVIWSVFLGVRRLDPSLGLDRIPLDHKLTPFEIACLRGGGRALLHTMLFDLWRRGFLGIVEAKGDTRQMVRAEDGPDPSKLDKYEREILDVFETPRKLTGLLNEARLVALADRRALDLESPLHDELLLMPGEARSLARSVAWVAGTLLVLLAGYKLGVAMAKGHHNVLFLIVSTVLTVIGVAVAATLPRQTWRGSDYLDRLRRAFGGWSDRLREEPGVSTSPNAVLAVALLSNSALAGIPQGEAWLSIGTAPNASGSGGGGCGGDGGGSGCGGGCGGCGGCGG
jgi:uncharacterized protein (TIGR04222 family)